tara:strand:+ start:140 stop:970 length:831 start_codon:yes stop_codon:yes gene_type:complete
MIKLIKDSFTHFLDSDPFQEGAALAYYSIFSLVPVIIIIISILDLFFSKQMVSGEIFGLFKDLLGEDAAAQLQNTINDQNTNHNSVVTTIIGFVTLAFTASGILSQIHDSFNRIWNLNAKVKNNIFSYASKHVMSFVLLIVFLFFIFLTTCLNSFLVKHYDSIHIDYNYLVVVEHLFSFVVASIIFTIMYKTLGDAKLNLKPAILGGLVTSFLFFVGKIGIVTYFGYSNPSSNFGASSFLGLFMLWIYYISQIIFFGASFVKVVSDRLNLLIVKNN